MCLWQFTIHYASNSISSGGTLRDYIYLLVQITNRRYVRNHFISNVLKKTKLFSFNTSTVTFFLAVSNLLPLGCNRWSFGMDKYFHPTPYWACDYLSMLELKLNHVSKRGYRCEESVVRYQSKTKCRTTSVINRNAKSAPDKPLTDIKKNWTNKVLL